MKKVLLDMLICPRCLPEEHPLQATINKASQDDIGEGTLHCSRCRTQYPIQEGVAFLNPEPPAASPSQNRYETLPVLASYLWSHYGDLLKDEHATDAYSRWATLMGPDSGAGLDTGSAVGRFTFEMAKKFDFVVGIDTSVAFIRTSRDLMRQRRADLALPEEGMLTRQETLSFPEEWRTDNVEFIVGDAQALPFRSGAFSGLSSLNVVDKVPKPLMHLAEINRVAQSRDAQFLFSDPFSWSTDVAPAEDWLGGKSDGQFAGRGQANVMALLEGEIGSLAPAWQTEGHGQVWWKIRTHCNHFEMIRSCYIKARR